MKNYSPLLLVVLVFLLLLLMVSPVYAAMSPEEIKEIKNNAPLQITGKVTKDVLLHDSSEEKSYPSQIRKIRLQVSKVIKKPSDFSLKAGESLDVFYTYVPSWVETIGGAKMNIIEGDKIEIWMERGKNGWEPAAGGDTVNHLHYAEPRKGPIPEPFVHGIMRNVTDNKVNIINGIFAVLSLVILFLILSVAFQKRKKTKENSSG